VVVKPAETSFTYTKPAAVKQQQEAVKPAPAKTQEQGSKKRSGPLPLWFAEILVLGSFAGGWGRCSVGGVGVQWDQEYKISGTVEGILSWCEEEYSNTRQWGAQWAAFNWGLSVSGGQVFLYTRGFLSGEGASIRPQTNDIPHPTWAKDCPLRG
jgi:hypothetical protein